MTFFTSGTLFYSNQEPKPASKRLTPKEIRDKETRGLVHSAELGVGILATVLCIVMFSL